MRVSGPRRLAHNKVSSNLFQSNPLTEAPPDWWGILNRYAVRGCLTVVQADCETGLGAAAFQAQRCYAPNVRLRPQMRQNLNQGLCLKCSNSAGAYYPE